MVQDAVNRWWWQSLMMFGPSDANSPNSAELMRWGVKLESNDELRQRFVNITVPQANILGLKLPDENLKFNSATKNWEFGEINWEEFYNVINGNGPCNAERMKARRNADENGKWVREAAEEYVRKSMERGVRSGEQRAER
jgi:ring-1,2-phenylacetyl-CoA epoxidase subunit PaaA